MLSLYNERQVQKTFHFNFIDLNMSTTYISTNYTKTKNGIYDQSKEIQLFHMQCNVLKDQGTLFELLMSVTRVSNINIKPCEL